MHIDRMCVRGDMLMYLLQGNGRWAPAWTGSGAATSGNVNVQLMARVPLRGRTATDVINQKHIKVFWNEKIRKQIQYTMDE